MVVMVDLSLYNEHVYWSMKITLLVREVYNTQIIIMHVAI